MKPHILFLHGALASGGQLKELASRLSSSATTHIITFRGHGNEPLLTKDLSVDILVSDVLRYMETNNISSAVFFGYSMGGYVALSLAVACPEKVKGIVTLGTKLNWNPESAAAEVSKLNPELMEQKIPDYIKALDAVHTAIGWKKLVVQTGGLMLLLGEKHLLDSDFSEIVHPVTLCIGEKDKMVSEGETRHVASLLTNGKCIVLENTGHVFEQADLQLLTEIIMECCAIQ